MKVIFLDIDGPICNLRSHFTYGKEGGIWHEWDPLACEAIVRCGRKGVKLVISSTWRFHEKDLWPMMDKHSLTQFVYQPDWKTKRLADRDEILRGHEIKDYLDRHPEITGYKIVDDDIDMLEDQMDNLIQADCDDGLSSTNIQKLLRWAGALKS